MCDRVRSQISLDLDGELSQLERAMVARHLDRCSSCEAFRGDLTAFTSTLRETPLEHPEHAIVLPRLRRARLDGIRGAALRVGAAAAGIALILGVGLGERELVGSAGSKSSGRPAYLDSQSYEGRFIRQAHDYRLVELHSLVRPV